MNISDVFSLQNTTAEATEVGKQDLNDGYKQLYMDIEWWMNSIFYITLPVFGGFGNILTFIVMRRGSLKDLKTLTLRVSTCLCWHWQIQVNKTENTATPWRGK